MGAHTYYANDYSAWLDKSKKNKHTGTLHAQLQINYDACKKIDDDICNMEKGYLSTNAVDSEKGETLCKDMVRAVSDAQKTVKLMRPLVAAS